MSDNNFNNIQDFETNYELKKALNKLENELQKKEYEVSAITNLYQDIKNLNEKIKKENNDLTNKLNTVRNEKNLIEKKYLSEIDTLKDEHSKEIEIYNGKILNLSGNNPDYLRKNIEIEMQNKYKQQLLIKDKEKEELYQELMKSRNEYELLVTEYDAFKADITDEMNALKQMHKNEINTLIEKIRIGENLKNFDDEQGGSSENIIQLKNEHDAVRRQVTELNNEIDKLRHDKEILTIEKNDSKINLVKIRDNQNFNQKKLESDLNRAQNAADNLQRENINLNNNLKNKEFQIQDLSKEIEILKDKLSNMEMERQDTKNTISNLKKMVIEKDEGANNILSEREKASNEMLMKERQEKENYQNQINELNMKLKEAKSEDLIKKENEIESLKKEISLLKKEMQYDNNGRAYKELLNKYKSMTDKKNQYKLQCKIANENMDKLFKNLTEQQQKEFYDIVQSTKMKYTQ